MRTATPFATCSVTSERAELGDLGRDLDAAVHRPGMHDERVGLEPRRPLGGEAPAAARTRGSTGTAPDRCAPLDAQQVHDVDIGRARRRGRSATVTGQPSSRSGRSVGGPTSVTSQPSAWNAFTLLRATRELRDVADDRDPAAVERRAAVACAA